MSGGFHVWSYLHNEFLDHNPHVGGAAVAGVALLAAGAAYGVMIPKVKAARAKGGVSDEVFVPSSRLGLSNIFDLSGSLVQSMAKDIIGRHYVDFIPILVFIFMWTLLNNVLGMVPGLVSSTDNLNTTMAMGLSVFLYYNLMGFKHNGLRYLEHFTGHLKGVLLLLLGPIMFVIELVSHSVRPLTLGIRLRSNIYADHTVYEIVANLFSALGAFLSTKLGIIGSIIGGMLSALGPVPIVILGLLVSFIQAFVFMLLTTIYIGMATAHDEH